MHLRPALSLLPGFQIQIPPVPRVPHGFSVMLSGYRVQMTERFQAWRVGQRLGDIHVALQHIPQCQDFRLFRLDGAEAGFVERFLGVAVHQHQAVEHPALLNYPLNVGVKFHERGFKEATATKRNADLTREAVEFAASIFKRRIQLFVDVFFERLKEESDAGAHNPVCGYRRDPDREPIPPNR